MPDEYDEALLDYEEAALKPIEKHENILQRAAKAMMNSMSQMGNAPDPQHPFQSGLGAVSQGMKNIVPSYSGYTGAHEAKSGVVRDNIKNPLLAAVTDVATDPETIMGTGALFKGAKGLARNVRNPSKVFGERMSKAQASNPEGRIDFSSILSKHSDDPLVKKVLERSGVLDRFGGTHLTPEVTIEQNLSKMKLEDAQEMQNMIKAGLRQSLKEGSAVKSTEIGLKKLLKELSTAENKAFPDMQGAKSSYGMARNINKFGKGVAKRAGWAAQWAPIAGGLGILGKAAFGSHPHQ